MHLCLKSAFVSFLLLLIADITVSNCQDRIKNQDASLLFNKYQSVKPLLDDTRYPIPLHVESKIKEKSLICYVFGEFDFPLEKVKNALCAINQWPDMLLLHENIKTCTIQKEDNLHFITFYFGRKKYQTPDMAYKITMVQKILHTSDQYVSMQMVADKGPLFTRNYIIEIQAIAIKDKTFIQLHCSYDYGNALQAALKLYYVTLAKNKVGFTITGYDEQSQPIYVNGTQGVIERNAIRYYFTILAHLNSLKYPESEQFEKAALIWYSLISKFPRQLVELSKDEYINNKRLERQNQIQYQSEISQIHGP